MRIYCLLPFLRKCLWETLIPTPIPHPPIPHPPTPPIPPSPHPPPPHKKKTVIVFVHENHRICGKYVQKYFYTFRINQSTFTYGERERNGLTFTECSVSLPISAAFNARLKMKLPQCNAIRVRTPPGFKLRH